MRSDEELEYLRQENQALRAANRALQAVNQTRLASNQALRAGLQEAITAIGALQQRVKELEGVVACQQERTKILEGQLAKDSHNSSFPPSSDRFARPIKSLRQPSGKKAGGQKGHPGHHLRQVEKPDEVLIHPVVCCQHCQHDLRTQPAQLPEHRQVIDLPTKRIWITEHRVEEKQCPCCSHVTRASFPVGVRAPTQYGMSLQALAVYLVEGQSLPYARASQVLREVLGVQLSGGSIATFVKICHQPLAEVEAALRTAVVNAPVLHQDETGMRVGKEGWWVHVCAMEQLTYYAAHPSRGRPGLDAIGIAPQFHGTSVHDGLLSYQGYACTQALCNVHHLRELTFMEEELKQPWARKMKDLLLEMKAAVRQAKVLGKPELDLLTLAELLVRYDEIVTEGYHANPPPGPPRKTALGKRLPGKAKQSPARNLLDRFSQRKWEVLRFLQDFAVPFDNNQAERDLRMVKVQQKVSGCFRTQEGIAMFCRMRSYLSTLHKQGIARLSALEAALCGHPVFPALT